jgi:hypothetical protein
MRVSAELSPEVRKAAGSVLAFVAWCVLSAVGSSLSWHEVHRWELIVATAAGYGLLTVLPMAGLLRCSLLLARRKVHRELLATVAEPRRIVLASVALGALFFLVSPVGLGARLWLAAGAAMSLSLAAFAFAGLRARPSPSLHTRGV